ncbi:mercuric transport protein MerTP [Subsaximicrobium wynnwilliamsii]|uniref:Mercuric transport protein MerT n=1 Tax=Subsaximicrobium wynnwilliamsii TaxID=291179 RepID=A0A5C6ZAD9_9FLAO|nr:mercuric transport protein MerTP [Subsaximicrobium wynnwilliamsii]TXD84483.1 mercuric transport protein MerTP [Subsaximicrobium wynnwilliamsii]TXD86569.1 mercuric transport protein MerTP [Subsaximicrobium wynnwilliamsii]TXE04216.1 mercuric transport protein MerTP [Subsaximicrobium wynnwilliamsii]
MSTEETSKKAAYTGLFAAVAASSCCIPPVIALIAGVGGSTSALSWMEPFRPYLIVLAIVAIGYAWYDYLKQKKVEDCCEIDAKPKWFQTKGFLIGITLFAVISISFPYYSHIFYPDNKKEIVIVNQSNIQTVNFDVQGMTCASCEQHVTHAVKKLEGIVNVAASFEKANTKVEFDDSKTSKEDIEKAINSTGYKVIDKEEN